MRGMKFNALAGSPAASSVIKGREPGCLIESTLLNIRPIPETGPHGAHYSASVMTGELAETVRQGGNGFSRKRRRPALLTRAKLL